MTYFLFYLFQYALHVIVQFKLRLGKKKKKLNWGREWRGGTVTLTCQEPCVVVIVPRGTSVR